MKHSKTIIATVGLATLMMLFVTPQAQATMLDGTPPGLALTFREHGGGPPAHASPRGLLIAGSKFGYHHSHKGKVNIDIDIEADADPFVYAVLTCVNMTGTAQSFTTSAIVAPIFPALHKWSLTGGSVSFTLLDMNGDGATLSTVDATTPLYMSQVDGTNYVPLMTAPDSWSTNSTDAIGPEEFGTPIPSLPGPKILNSIGIELSATLSAKDHAYIVARFEGTPEPGTMVLLTIGGLAVLLRRKRSRA